MKHLKRLSAFLLCAALLCGCAALPEPVEELPPAAAASSEPVEEEPFILPDEFALPYYSELSLDPVTCPDGVQYTVASLLCEGLFELDERFAPQPLLCASYTRSEDCTVYTFSLRTDARFSDGSALTAADAADTLRRARSSPRYAARLSEVTSVAAEDGAVTVKLSAPNASLPSLLDIPIVKAGTADSGVIGTGPYRLDDSGAETALAANPYWTGGRQPIERIALRSARDEDAVLYQFTSHDTQLITADLTGRSPVSVTGSVQFYDADSTLFQFVGMNAASPRLSSSAVRRALAKGLDREQIVSACLSGHAKAAQYPLSPVCADYPSSLESSYSYDAFAQAMAAVGLDSGQSVTLRMLVNEENSFKVAAARSIAAQLSAFDLKIELETLPWEEYTAALTAGAFDLYYGEVKLTADWDLRPLLATGGALNYGGYSDSTLDTLLSAVRSADAPSTALLAVCRRLQTQSPILPVCFKTVSTLTQRGSIEGLASTAADPFYGLSGCTIQLRAA